MVVTKQCPLIFDARVTRDLEANTEDHARNALEIYSIPTTTFPTTSGLRIMQDKNHELQIDCRTVEASRIRYWNDRIPLILRYHFPLFRCQTIFNNIFSFYYSMIVPVNLLLFKC